MVRTGIDAFSGGWWVPPGGPSPQGLLHLEALVRFDWLDWLSWGVVVLGAAWLGASLRRWVDAYAARLRAGAQPDVQALWAAARDVRRRRARALPDGFWAILSGAGAGLMLPGGGWPALGAWALCAGLVLLAWIDARTGLLPDALTLPALVLGWAAGPLTLVEASSASALVWVVLSAASGLYRVLRGQDGFGAGDAKYLAAVAGWTGLGPALAVLWGACVLGLLVWVVRVPCRGQAQPFGPFLTAVAVPGVLFAPAVQSWF